MAETLTTPDGKPIELPDAVQEAQRQFAASMAADTPAEVPPPPKRAERPETADKPKARRGRPPKAARVAAPSSAPSGGKSTAVVKSDYTEDAQSLVAGVWTVAAGLPPTQPFAFVINANADALSSALAEGAKHNDTIRKWVSQGENTWKLQLASVGLTMGMQCLQIMRDPDLREQAREKTKEQFREALKAQGIELPEEQANANQSQES